MFILRLTSAIVVAAIVIAVGEACIEVIKKKWRNRK